MKFNLILLLLLAFSCTQITHAQSLAINTDGSTANASALLDVKSTAKGLLIPRMSKMEKNAITTPATGLLIFQETPDSTGFYYYNGTAWTWLLSGSNADSLAWKTNGNDGITTNNFIGTKNNAPFIVKTNNVEQMRLTANRELGIGTATPNSTYGFAKVEIASEGFLAPADLLIRNAANDAGYAPGLVFQHARGTLATPLTVNNGDYLSAISTMNYDGSNYILSAGLDIYADGAIAAGIVPTRLQLNTMNTTGTYAARLTIKNDGKVGVGIADPSTLFANNNSNTVGVDGFGLNSNSINWSMNAGGYVAGIFNSSTNTNTNGLVIKLAGTTLSNRILDLSTNATQTTAGTPVMIVSGDGTVGIGTASANSTLHVDGTVAVGLSMGVAGGTAGSPFSLASAKYYIGLLPADAVNNNYQLPSPVAYPGRVYVIRNNSSVNPAVLSTAAGLLFPGSSSTGISTYTLNAGSSVKTVMVISDGANWTIMAQN